MCECFCNKLKVLDEVDMNNYKRFMLYLDSIKTIHTDAIIESIKQGFSDSVDGAELNGEIKSLQEALMSFSISEDAEESLEGDDSLSDMAPDDMGEVNEEVMDTGDVDDEMPIDDGAVEGMGEGSEYSDYKNREDKIVLLLDSTMNMSESIDTSLDMGYNNRIEVELHKLKDALREFAYNIGTAL
jgi:hypothetical protein